MDFYLKIAEVRSSCSLCVPRDKLPKGCFLGDGRNGIIVGRGRSGETVGVEYGQGDFAT